MNGIHRMCQTFTSEGDCLVEVICEGSCIDAFDAHLLPTSPAVDAGTTDGAPTDDFAGRPRDDQPDIGAYEWRVPVAWVYLPTQSY